MFFIIQFPYRSILSSDRFHLGYLTMKTRMDKEWMEDEQRSVRKRAPSKLVTLTRKQTGSVLWSK